MPNRNYLFFFITFIFLIQLKAFGQDKWLEKDSKHFRIIYKKEEAYLVNNLINYAETSLSDLDSVFNFIPSEKIIIYLFDYSDYGYGATTTVPENFIRLEIEPLELAYENIPLKNRIRWLISHELVHVIVNDQASSFEKAMRAVFSKVPPEQEQPLTVFYSLITNHNRFTPVWYQEGIAVFFETWENGGFGRVLGNFDETYFRTLVAENKNFPSINKLDAKLNVTSFLQGMAFYLYGTRFCTYLAIKYGTKKLLSWYKEKPGEFYENYTSRFRDIFGLPLNKAWKDFINNEKKFQLKNISRIKKGKLTNIIRLSSKSDGWITKEYYEPSDNSVIFGYNAPNHLAGIKKLYLKNKLQVKIGTLPTPSLVRVASTAYDKNNKLFFYTTKNNELFRDLNVLDTKTGDSKLLFKNCRIGDITVSPQNHDLWGVIHSDGRTGIVYSSYPYKDLEPIVGFNLGDDISDLSVSPDGKFLAGVLHRSSGSQLIFLTSCDTLKKTKHFRYLTITDKGSPEFPSWSSNGNFLFWNAYVNGVSNIYRKNFASENSEIEPLSNVVDGLFKPVYINKDSIFAFEFTSKGFIPVIIPNKEAEFLPAIKYLGDEVVAKDPQVTRWNLSDNKNNTKALFDSSKVHYYNSIASLKVTSFVPVITGFQDQKVLGIYTHISDPLLINDLTMEFGISPFKNNSNLPEFHFKGKYEYRKELTLNYEYNPTDFYDLFNKRKRGLTGSRYGMEYSHYWIYSNPLKLIQKFGVDYYTGIKFLTDNIVKVSQPDFFVAHTTLNSKNVRRSIGSVDYEEGNEINFSASSFGNEINFHNIAGQFYGEWDNFSTWLFPHNIFHFKLSAGYTINTNKLVQAKFYLGGFGNRYVEDQNVDQYRKIFSFPGIPIYSLQADNFGKILLENELPPVRFSNAFIGNQYLSHLSLCFYSQALLPNMPRFSRDYKLRKIWFDLGSQINFVFHHWYNLESTLSAGIAKAWYNNGNSWEWFISLKLLKNKL